MQFRALQIPRHTRGAFNSWKKRKIFLLYLLTPVCETGSDSGSFYEDLKIHTFCKKASIDLEETIFGMVSWS